MQGFLPFYEISLADCVALLVRLIGTIDTTSWPRMPSLRLVAQASRSPPALPPTRLGLSTQLGREHPLLGTPGKQSGGPNQPRLATLTVTGAP